MLFLIYVNDVNDVSMHLTCNTELYANDTTLHESAKCISTIQKKTYKQTCLKYKHGVIHTT